MNLESAKELLDDVAKQMAEIEAIYGDAKHKEEIVQVARPKVKSCLEHLRSSLEFVAANLAKTLPPPPKSAKKGGRRQQVVFPYGRNAKLYGESLARNLPGLDVKYRELIDGLQPHVCGDPWLVLLAGATNFNKHVDLQRQERKNVDPRSLSLGNLLRLEGSGTVGRLVIGGRVINPKGPLTVHTDVAELDVPDSLPVSKVYGDVKFILKGSGVDLLELLTNAHSQITQFVSEMEKR